MNIEIFLYSGKLKKKNEIVKSITKQGLGSLDFLFLAVKI